MLKQFKILTLALTCFGSCRNHHQGAVLCLAKTTNMVFSVLVSIDIVLWQHISLLCRCTVHRTPAQIHYCVMYKNIVIVFLLVYCS